MRLGKPLLPVAIERVETELLPSEIARLQIMDYALPDESSAFKLVGAIMGLPAPPALPDPLPEQPAVPLSYLAIIADQLSVPTLSQDEQFAIVGKLERAFAPSADPHERAAAYEFLSQMEERSDLLAAVDRRIAILKNRRPQPPGPASEPPRLVPKPPRQAPAPPAAGAVKPHWVMAIVALIIFFPLGIPAVVNAARVAPRQQMGDLAAARRSSANVKIFFWISVAIYGIGVLADAFQGLGSAGAAALGDSILP
jgi:Interferon-induced transmembrane protein